MPIEFGVKDFIDILLVAFFAILHVYKLMKASGSIQCVYWYTCFYSYMACCIADSGNAFAGIYF